MNWFWTKRQRFRYTYDRHSHLLPGLDDGVSSYEEALTAIRMLYDTGIRRMTLTPHIAPPGMPNSDTSIRPVLHTLRHRLEAESLSMEIDAAAEYRITPAFPALMKHPLMTAPDGSILVEHPFRQAAPGFDDAVRHLQHKGCYPILAHPERYPFLQDDIERTCRTLRDNDVRIQVNLLSFAGKYGPEARDAAQRLLKTGQLDFVASDAHSPDDVLELQDFLCSRMAGRLADFFRLEE